MLEKTKIGETTKIYGIRIEVCDAGLDPSAKNAAQWAASVDACEQCAFKNNQMLCGNLACTPETRADAKRVFFKKIKK